MWSRDGEDEAWWEVADGILSCSLWIDIIQPNMIRYLGSGGGRSETSQVVCAAPPPKTV